MERAVYTQQAGGREGWRNATHSQRDQAVRESEVVAFAVFMYRLELDMRHITPAAALPCLPVDE